MITAPAEIAVVRREDEDSISDVPASRIRVLVAAVADHIGSYVPGMGLTNVWEST